MENLLFESNKFEYVITESANGRLRVGGTYQLADAKNANNRVYPRGLWERVLGNPDLKEKIEARRMLGMLGHPGDGRTDLEKSSHIVTKLEMIGNKVYGESEVLDTPCGKILEALLRSGVKMGISSRGAGEVESRNGVAYVKESYRLETFDFVLDPSTPGAFPAAMESADVALRTINQEVQRKDLKESDKKIYRSLVEEIRKSPDPTIQYRANALSESLEGRNHTSSMEGTGMELTGDMKTLVEGQIKLKELELRNEFSKEREGFTKQASTVQEQLTALQKENTTLKTKLENAAKLGDELMVQYKNSNLKAQHFAEMAEGLSELPQRYEAAKAIIESLINRLKGMNETSQRYHAAVKLISEMVKLTRGKTVKSYTESALAKVPQNKRDAAKIIIEGCTSQEQVESKLKAFLGETAPASKVVNTKPDNEPLNKLNESKNMNENKSEGNLAQSLLRGVIGRVSGR